MTFVFLTFWAGLNKGADKTSDKASTLSSLMPFHMLIV